MWCSKGMKPLQLAMDMLHKCPPTNQGVCLLLNHLPVSQPKCWYRFQLGGKVMRFEHLLFVGLEASLGRVSWGAPQAL